MYQVEPKSGSFTRQWVDLIGYEDYYWIEPMDGLIVKKRNPLDDPNSVIIGDRRCWISPLKKKNITDWDKVSLNSNGISTYHYLAIILAKMFVPNPHNYRFVEWKYRKALCYVDEIAWVESKTVDSRDSLGLLD